MNNTDYKYKEHSDVIDCNLADNPETFREVTLEELLGFENCYLTCNSEDDVWQYYFVKTGKTMNNGFFVKIKYDVVLQHLQEKDE